MALSAFRFCLILAFSLETHQIAGAETEPRVLQSRHDGGNGNRSASTFPFLVTDPVPLELVGMANYAQGQEEAAVAPVLSAAEDMQSVTEASAGPKEEDDAKLTSKPTPVPLRVCSGGDCTSLSAPPTDHEGLEVDAGGAQPRRLHPDSGKTYSDAATQTSGNPLAERAHGGHAGQYVYIDGVGLVPVWAVPSSTTTTTTTTTTLFPPPKALYPTAIQSLEQPSKSQKEACMVKYTVSALTRGKGQVLAPGCTKAHIGVQYKSLVIESHPNRQVPQPWFGRRWMRRLKQWFEGTNLELYFYTALPAGCTHPPNDDYKLIMAEGIENGKVKDVRLRLVPELYATYGVSPVQPPKLPSPYYFGRDQLKELPHCVYAMRVHTPIEVGSLRLKASLHTAKVEGRLLDGSEPEIIASVDFSHGCRPSRLDYISWWVERADTTNPFVILHVGYLYTGKRFDPDEVFERVSVDEYDEQNRKYLM